MAHRLTPNEIKDEITALFSETFDAKDNAAYDIIPSSLTSGKLYEAYALSLITLHLYIEEGFELTLKNDNYISLKSSPGPINPAYPHIAASKNGRLVAELWTDIEFLSFSYSASSASTPNKGHYHELDVVMVDAGALGRPTHDQIWLAAECKFTSYKKGLLKEILGVRREMGLLAGSQRTKFKKWPATHVNSDPASCLLVYSSDERVLEYSDPGDVFGINFYHEQIEV